MYSLINKQYIYKSNKMGQLAQSV